MTVRLDDQSLTDAKQHADVREAGAQSRDRLQRLVHVVDRVEVGQPEQKGREQVGRKEGPTQHQ